MVSRAFPALRSSSSGAPARRREGCQCLARGAQRLLALALALAYLAGAGLARAAHRPPRRADPSAAPVAACAIDGDMVLHGRRDSRVVALTFDACPTSHVPGFSPEIVDRLAAEHVPATFFVSGRWAEQHQSELRQITAEPFFELALHGYRHHHLRDGWPDAAVGEIEDGREALQRLGYAPAPLFRPPYGDHPRLLADAARRAGVTPILWDVAPGDPDPHETAADLERAVLQHVQGGSIIVLHVNGRGVSTAAALPTLLTDIRARGLRFVTVSELVGECAGPSAARSQ
jgi:peptidoglycan-N-acetylglucosamine deacetylase